MADAINHPGLKATVPPAEATAPAAPGAADWQSLTVVSVPEAERLLDQLYAGGATECELLVIGPATIIVRWR